jgi:hypothetical protein
LFLTLTNGLKSAIEKYFFGPKLRKKTSFNID